MSIASRISSMEEHVTNAYNGLQGLGADLTGIDKNIDNIASVLDNIYDSMPQVSGEGTSLTLDDTRVGKIKSTLKGNTSQTGTPTPTTPIPVNVVSGDNEIVVCGKNLFDNEKITRGGAYSYGTTGGVPTYSGSDARATISPANSIKVSPSTAYTLTFPISGFRYALAQMESGYIRLGDSGWKTDTTYTFTTNATTNYIAFNFSKTDNSAISDSEWGTLKNGAIQLEVGSSASTYEPYQGNTYNIDLPVENVLPNPITTQTLNGITVTRSDDGTLTFNGTSTAITYFDFSTNFDTTKYTGYKFYGFPTNAQGLGIRISTSNRSALQDIGANGVALNDNGTNKYIALRIGSGITLTNYILKPMLISPTITSASYTPYGTTPIELCKIGDYQDYFYKDSDKWYLHKEIGKVVLNGSETVEKVANGKFRAVQSINFGQYGYGTSNQMYSNYFKNKADYATYTTGEGYAWNYYIYFGLETSVTTTTDAQTWLTNNTPTFYGILATPTNEEITYQPLIDQLNLLEKAMSKDGQTNISQVNNDLPFIISASALKEWSV